MTTPADELPAGGTPQDPSPGPNQDVPPSDLMTSPPGSPSSPPDPLGLPEPDGTSEVAAPAWTSGSEPALPTVGLEEAAPAASAPDMRLEIDAPSVTGMQTLGLWRDEIVAWFKTLASAAVYATLIVTFGFQVARVEGQSMAPTLADQDRLIVNKFAYRIGEPRRGDIVMLYYPLNPDKSFVKRVIAEEGDTVRIVDGQVFVNDVPLLDDFVPAEYRSHDEYGPTVIPEGYAFVLGDHRNNSSDSRHWGFVPKKYIIGKVQIRWWPIPSSRVF